MSSTPRVQAGDRRDRAKRPVTFLLGLLLPVLGLPVVGAPSVKASGAAVCAIGGTIRFVPVPALPTQGTWSIEPAVITCQGVFRAYERITGPASFTGSGTYTAISGAHGCLHYVGTGNVDYTLPTTEADVHISERQEFVLVAAGAFVTPSLKGSFQAIHPYNGDCVTEPVSKASFVAEGALVRISGGPQR